MREIDPDAVLAELENLDEDGNPKVVASAKPAPVAEPVAPPKPAPSTNPAMDVAWDTVKDYVSETCPDIDEETVAVLMVASSGVPLTFKSLAKKMQAKITAAKVGESSGGASPETAEQTAVRLAGQIFGGGNAGGDAATAQKPGEPTAEERLKKAQEAGDSKGVMFATAQAIKEKRLFERGVQLVID